MKLKIIFVGQSFPSWIQEGLQEYQKRIPKNYHFELISIPLQHRPKSDDYKRLMEQEGERMLQYIPSDALCIALDIQGSLVSTDFLCKQLADWQMDARTVCFCIGGPEGLAENCSARANLRWSLSRMTFPHPFVPLILTEQLYRAYTILIDHPYHK